MRRSLIPALVVPLCLAVLAGCGGGSRPVLPAHTAADGRGAIRPLPAPKQCTQTVTDTEQMDRAMDEAKPGTRICLIGDLHGKRLVLKRSGTAGQPIELVGDGRTVLRGLSVQGNYVQISGVNLVRPIGPGASLRGNFITFENNTVLSPRGKDGDGLRFFGKNITITHNTIRDTVHLGGAHADCMQTFATDEDNVASEQIQIADNRCERISNICLMAEGPNSSAGDGSGVGASSNFYFRNNYCENHADQALMIDDVSRVEATDNEIEGAKPKAFAFQNRSTNALVNHNTIGDGIDYEVGMDETSKPGYQGPDVGGKP